VSIFAEGDLYRHAVEQPDRPIILAGMWLLFGTMGLVGLSMLVAQGGDALSRGTGLAMLAFSAVLLARVTLRYHALRSRRAAEPGVPHEGNRPAA
jgi:hypothetical protein